MKYRTYNHWGSGVQKQFTTKYILQLHTANIITK